MKIDRIPPHKLFSRRYTTKCYLQFNLRSSTSYGDTFSYFVFTFHSTHLLLTCKQLQYNTNHIYEIKKYSKYLLTTINNYLCDIIFEYITRMTLLFYMHILLLLVT